MWNKPGSLRSKTAQGRFRTWWVFSWEKGKSSIGDFKRIFHLGEGAFDVGAPRRLVHQPTRHASLLLQVRFQIWNICHLWNVLLQEPLPCRPIWAHICPGWKYLDWSSQKTLLFKNSSIFFPILGRWESNFSSRPGLVCKMRHRGGDGHQFLQRGEQWASTKMQNSKSKRVQRVSTMEWAVYTKSAHIFRQLGFQHLTRIGNFYWDLLLLKQVKVRPGQDTDRPTPYRMILDETSDLDMPDRWFDKWKLIL